MSNAQFSIVIDSIGTASLQLVRSLKHISPLSDSQLAALIFQAPSVLISHLEEKTAYDMNAILRSAGAETQVRSIQETVTPGDKDHEVALVVQDVQFIPKLIEQVIGLLGIDFANATRLLCQTPTVLLGNVSANTVEALRTRFAPFHAELDVSKPKEARFDVYLGACQQPARLELAQKMRRKGIALANGRETLTQQEPLLAADVDYENAMWLWQTLESMKIPGKILNHDFQRFDLKLDAADLQNSALIQYFTTHFQMPEAVIPKLQNHLPVVLKHNLRFADLNKYLTELAELGACVSGHLLAFQRFDLQLASIPDVPSSAKVISMIANRPVDRIAAVLQQIPATVNGPFTAHQGRWMLQELKKLHTEGSLIIRS